MKIMQYLNNNFGVNLPADVIWSHAVNSQEKLARTLADDNIMIIESDIRQSPTGKIVCAHPPLNDGDLSYEDLIQKVKNSNKALKLDFKDPQIYEEALIYLKSQNLNNPVILNADALTGNMSNPSKFDIFNFIELSQKHYSHGILSPGWTSVVNPDVVVYTKEKVDEMESLLKSLKYEEIMFPLRACALENSWEFLKPLLSKENHYLCIWNNEPVDTHTLEWIKSNTDKQKTYYDYIDENAESIRL